MRYSEMLKKLRLMLFKSHTVFPSSYRSFRATPDQYQSNTTKKNDFLPAEYSRISVIGSGSFGTAMARVLAQINVNKNITLWVNEEIIDGRNLSVIINEAHMNVKYLPNISLPGNIIAKTNLMECTHSADVIFFAVPHQYLKDILHKIGRMANPECVCASFIKGIVVDKFGPKLVSDEIRHVLNVNNVGVIMGANVASDVATDSFVETTVAFSDISIANSISGLLYSKTMRTSITNDVGTVELCGALKNVVAIGAGFCDGIGVGESTKAAVIRQGLEEIRTFCQLFDFYGTYQDRTLFASCGIADLIATCYGGRNRRCAEEFSKRLSSIDKSTNDDLEVAVEKLWNNVEIELLGGQKLQGIDTCKDVMKCILHVDSNNSDHSHSSDYILKKFPLFSRIYNIAVLGKPIDTLFDW
eukprot:gene5750-7939_t